VSQACPACGQETTADTAEFCPHCGAPLDVVSRRSLPPAVLIGVIATLWVLPFAIVGGCFLGADLGTTELGIIVGAAGIALWFALFAQLLRYGSRR
jgi:hypothetical protein